MELNTSLDSSSERFIPLRGTSFGSMKVSHNHPSPVNVSCKEYCRKFMKNDSDINYMQYFYQKNQYKDVLVNTLFQSPRRVLYFSPKQKARTDNDQGKAEIDWPVKARKRPLITKPETVLDMPGLNKLTTGARQTLDWGSSGYIAALIKYDCIYFQNPDNNLRFGLAVEDAVKSLKFNKEGDRLALSMKNKSVQIFDIHDEKMVMRASWKPSEGMISYITYTTRLLITVHTSGMIQIWDHNLQPVSSVCHAHKGKILSAKVSCNEKYLATNGVDSFVKIWYLPSCQSILQIFCYIHPVASIDWHPWQEPLLVVGISTRNNFCTVWNVNKLSNMYTTSDVDDPKIDCVTFNPLSAELVVGFWLDSESEQKLAQNIVIQSNLNTVVDDINFHSGRTLYLMWDKEGKRLASVGTDENIAIWNFFGRERKNLSEERITIKKETSIFRDGIIR